MAAVNNTQSAIAFCESIIAGGQNLAQGDEQEILRGWCESLVIELKRHGKWKRGQ